MTAQPKPADQPSEYLTVAEAAARYHVSRDYIRHRIIDGSLPAVRSGRRIIRVNSVELEGLFPSHPVKSIVAAHRPRIALSSPLAADISRASGATAALYTPSGERTGHADLPALSQVGWRQALANPAPDHITSAG